MPDVIVNKNGVFIDTHVRYRTISDNLSKQEYKFLLTTTLTISVMIEQQQKLVLSPYMEIYELVIPKDNLLRQIKELVDFNFIYDELLANYCLDNGRNAVPPIRMFKYLLLKSIYDLSDVDVVERSKYDMSFKYFFGHGSRR